jgi:hypothetical protein
VLRRCWQRQPARRSNSQAPSTKEAPSTKLKSRPARPLPRDLTWLVLQIWNFSGVWCLVLGVSLGGGSKSATSPPPPPPCPSPRAHRTHPAERVRWPHAKHVPRRTGEGEGLFVLNRACPRGVFREIFVGNFVENDPKSTKFTTKFATKFWKNGFLGQALNTLLSGICFCPNPEHMPGR